MATPPTTGIRAAYTGRVKNWPRNRALKSAVKSGSPAWWLLGKKNTHTHTRGANVAEKRGQSWRKRQDKEGCVRLALTFENHVVSHL